MTKDPKDLWIEAYEAEKEAGQTDEDAAKVADREMKEYLAVLIDDARDRLKYGDL